MIISILKQFCLTFRPDFALLLIQKEKSKWIEEKEPYDIGRGVKLVGLGGH
jgi:hypothetical protein